MLHKGPHALRPEVQGAEGGRRDDQKSRRPQESLLRLGVPHAGGEARSPDSPGSATHRRSWARRRTRSSWPSWAMGAVHARRACSGGSQRPRSCPGGDEAAVDAVASDPDSWLAQLPQAPGERHAGRRSRAPCMSCRPAAGCRRCRDLRPGGIRRAGSAPGPREGLNVFLFSSNVSVAGRARAEDRGAGEGAIVMGPDCGTAFLWRRRIGFANAVRRGPDRHRRLHGDRDAGVLQSGPPGRLGDISWYRDGKPRSLGRHRRHLDADGNRRPGVGPGTKVIAILSKPPGGNHGAAHRRLAGCGKPVVVCLLGASGGRRRPEGGVHLASTIDEPVAAALQAIGLRTQASLVAESLPCANGRRRGGA